MNMNKKPNKALRQVLLIGGAVCLVLLILMTGGYFVTDKIEPGNVSSRHEGTGNSGRTAQASIETVTEFFEAVGTVRPRTEANIEAQVTGRIVEVLVRAGDRVVKGDVLVVLDSREFQARLDQATQELVSAGARKEQARQAVLAAEAAFTQAESAFNRVKSYFHDKAATSQDLEQAESLYLQAKARSLQARDGLRETEAGIRRVEGVVEEARIALGYARIVAPENGQVARRLAESGDLAWPGKPLVVLQTRESLRLEALVREGLIHKAQPGVRLPIVLTALNTTGEGVVEEVVPSADPLTRTFLVKVGLEDYDGLFPGMFGRLLVPMDTHKVVVVPQEAVERVGQLEMVTVKVNGSWERRFIKTGRDMGTTIEVLSGLKGDETLAAGGGDNA
jgi:RND family efflux transporter MFP subunit